MQTYKDTFVEQLIRRDNMTKSAWLKLGAVLVGILLVLACYFFLYLFFPFFFAVICILEFFAFQYTRLEYEYSFTNGDFDVDRIQGKRHRKAVFSTNCTTIRAMAPLTEDNLSRWAQVNDKVLDVSVSPKSEGLWFFVADTGDAVDTRVLFSPNERILDAFRTYLGPKFKAQEALK